MWDQALVRQTYTYTVYSGANPYLQVSDSTALSGSGTPAISLRYLYGPAVDQILATDNCSGTVLWGLATLRARSAMW